MKDSFGVDVEPGDYVLSASMSGGRARIGTVYAVASGRLMLHAEHGMRGSARYPEIAKQQLGSMVAVLRKADGTVPSHIGYSDRILIDGEWRQIADPPELSERQDYVDVYDVWVHREDA